MERLTRFVLGPLLVLGGLFWVLLAFGFATLAFGGRDSPPGWGEYLRAVARGGASALGLGLVLVAGGVDLALARDAPKPSP